MIDDASALAAIAIHGLPDGEHELVAEYRLVMGHHEREWRESPTLLPAGESPLIWLDFPTQVLDLPALDTHAAVIVVTFYVAGFNATPPNAFVYLEDGLPKVSTREQLAVKRPMGVASLEDIPLPDIEGDILIRPAFVRPDAEAIVAARMAKAAQEALLPEGDTGLPAFGGVR